MSVRPRSRFHDRLRSEVRSHPILASAWLALTVATGWLVRAEVRRQDLPEGVRVSADLVYRDEANRRARLDVYEPLGLAPVGSRPALLALHGGGWRGGSKGDYGRSLAPLVRRGFVVVAADYRLSRPGQPGWPGNLDDVRAALRWVREHSARYRIDPNRVGVIGASAGAHLALLLGEASPVSDPAERVAAVVDFYGPTDLRALASETTGAGESVRLLLGSLPALDVASPLRRVASGGPPVLIIHGTDDALVPIAQSYALARALEEAGLPCRLIVVPGARHGFGLRVGSRDLVPEIVDFLRQVWGAPP